MTFVVKSEIPTSLRIKLSHLEAGRFINIACLALVAYDYSTTLSEEIDLFWASTWSITKCLFLLNRYSVFADPIIYMSITMFPIQSERTFCLTCVRWFAWTSTAGILLAQVILKLRTWAIWGRHRLITAVLAAEFAIALAINVFFVQEYLKGIDVVPGKVPGGGCIFTFSNRLIFVNFISILVSETTMVTLLLIKAVAYFQHEETVLMSRIVRDGLVYFLCILLVSVANVITILIAPIEIHAMLVVFQRVMHSILCNRVLCNIRRVLVKQTRDESTLASLDSSFSVSYLPSYSYELNVT